MIKTALTILLTLFSLNALANDFEEGFHAAEKGHYQKAIPLLKKAAKEGHSLAHVVLGLMYVNGKGVDKNFKEAFHWFEIAAHKKDPDGQYNLAKLYDKGQGVKKNTKEAAKWYELAAHQEVVDAQLRIGVMYQLGEGVKQSYTTANNWYELAAEKGDKDAHLMLGLAHWSGHGVKEDAVKGYMWAQIAANKGSQEAEKELSGMDIKITPAQKKDAVELAKKCTQHAFKHC